MEWKRKKKNKKLLRLYPAHRLFFGVFWTYARNRGPMISHSIVKGIEWKGLRGEGKTARRGTSLSFLHWPRPEVEGFFLFRLFKGGMLFSFTAKKFYIWEEILGHDTPKKYIEAGTKKIYFFSLQLSLTWRGKIKNELYHSRNERLLERKESFAKGICRASGLFAGRYISMAKRK